MAKSLREMPQCVHADRFDENRVYSISSYSKGNLFLTQLEYIIGKDNFMKTIKRYFLAKVAKISIGCTGQSLLSS